MRSAALLLLAATLPARVGAQHFSIAPEIGFYVPTEKLSKLSTGTEDFSELEAGPTFGARLGILFGKHIGIEASGAYVPSTYKLSSGNTITKQDAKLFLGTGQVVVFLLPRTSFVNVYLNGGVGVISHGGVAFTSAADKTDLSGVFGAGAGIRLGPIGVTAGAELFNYKSKSAESTQSGEALTQRDIRLKLGFGVPFGGR